MKTMSGETLGGIVFLFVVVAVLAFLFRRISTTKRVTVAEQVLLDGPPEALADEISRALSSIPGVTVGVAGIGRYLVSIRRCPAWVIIPVLLVFPVGIVLAFVIKEDVVLEVNVYDRSPGTLLQLLGQTDQNILNRLRAAVATIPVA
jgi:Ca2+/Na+ antiporter